MWDEWSHADGQAQRPPVRWAAPPPACAAAWLCTSHRCPARARSRRSRSPRSARWPAASAPPGSAPVSPQPKRWRARAAAWHSSRAARHPERWSALIAHIVLRALLDGLFGLHLSYEGGAIDGLVMGAAAGVGYALATPQPPGGGLAAPSGRATIGRQRHRRRVAAPLRPSALCAVRPPAGRWPRARHRPAVPRRRNWCWHRSVTSSASPTSAPITRALLSAFEGAVFGCALTWGLTRRPAPPGIVIRSNIINCSSNAHLALKTSPTSGAILRTGIGRSPARRLDL